MEAKTGGGSVGGGGGGSAGPLKEAVLVEKKGPVAIVTLNRPERLNALDSRLLRGITEACDSIAQDPEIRAVILTGAGKGFCSGADLKGGETLVDGVRQPTKKRGQRVYDNLMGEMRPALLAICNLQKPVIAAINLAAVLLSPLACDLRIMADDAYMLQAFINIGLIPDIGSTYFFARSVGYSKAFELSVEGKPIKADACLQLGLTNKVVPAKELLQRAEEWALQIARQPTFAVGLTKNALYFASTHNLPESFEYEARLQQYCAESADHAEGVDAFRNKRKAKFTGQASVLPRGLEARL